MKYIIINIVILVVIMLASCDKESISACNRGNLTWRVECNNCNLSLCDFDGCPVDLYIDGGLITSMNPNSSFGEIFVASQNFSTGDHAFMIKNGSSGDILADFEASINCFSELGVTFINTSINF